MPQVILHYEKLENAREEKLKCFYRNLLGGNDSFAFVTVILI